MCLEMRKMLSCEAEFVDDQLWENEQVQKLDLDAWLKSLEDE